MRYHKISDLQTILNRNIHYDTTLTYIFNRTHVETPASNEAVECNTLPWGELVDAVERRSIRRYTEESGVLEGIKGTITVGELLIGTRYQDYNT